MARYKAIDTSPRFLAVDLEKQLLPGRFEHAVHHLLDHEFDLSLFDIRQYPAQQKIGSVHATRAAEGRHTVEAVLPGTQHRKASASRVRAVGKKRGNPLFRRLPPSPKAEYGG